MKKNHVEIPGSSKKEMKFPAVKKDSCEISMCPGFWMVLKFPRGASQFCGISKDEALFSPEFLTVNQ